MRLCTFVSSGERRLGAQTASGIVDLGAIDSSLPHTMLELLAGGEAALARASAPPILPAPSTSCRRAP